MLHLIRARLDGGLRNKAERGELETSLPVGLDRDEAGRIVLSPDEQVRHAIARVFELWRRLGSARQVVTDLVSEGQKLPRRRVGERRIGWARASSAAVHDFLTNPAYAGAFVFGRTRQQKRLDAAGRVRRRTVELPLEEWSVCLPEYHPGHVSWQEYLATRERLRANGPPKAARRRPPDRVAQGPTRRAARGPSDPGPPQGAQDSVSGVGAGLFDQ
jgi:Recombinase